MLIVDTQRQLSPRRLVGFARNQPIHILQEKSTGRVILRPRFDESIHRVLWSGPIENVNFALKSLGIPWQLLPQTEENIQMIPLDPPLVEDDSADKTAILLGLVFLIGLLALMLKGISGSSQPSEDRLAKTLETIREKVVKPQKLIQVKIQKPMVSSTTQTKTPSTLKSSFPKGAFGQLMKAALPGVRITSGPTSKGPGLGGLEGSGGVQAAIYAKGMIAAPLGLGGRIEGAGGVGTKGRGGGQEGFGTLSLVGQTGASVLPGGGGARLSDAAGLDRDQIQAVIQQNIHDVRYCYEQGLKDNPNLAGRVTIHFIIGGNGLVKKAQVVSSSLQNATVEACMVEKLKRWTFPTPEGGVDVEVTYPFTLRRVGQG